MTGNLHRTIHLTTPNDIVVLVSPRQYEALFRIGAAINGHGKISHEDLRGYALFLKGIEAEVTGACKILQQGDP